MKILFNCVKYNQPYQKHYTSPYFGSNSRIYKSHTGKEMGTLTFPFRDDLDWKKLTEFELNHFKSHENVNIIQFASSDGSEAYSTIISLIESGNKNVEKFFPIKAYDIDKEIVRAANSGMINIHPENMKYIEPHCKNFSKYFIPSSEKLEIQNDFFDLIKVPYKTYRVCDELRKRVKFNHADMYDVMFQIEDKSNTILMCRNVLGYFSERQVKNTIEIISRKLKKGSLFVIGKFDRDMTLVEIYLKNNNFKEVLKNVYIKI